MYYLHLHTGARALKCLNALTMLKLIGIGESWFSTAHRLVIKPNGFVVERWIVSR